MAAGRGTPTSRRPTRDRTFWNGGGKSWRRGASTSQRGEKLWTRARLRALLRRAATLAHCGEDEVRSLLGFLVWSLAKGPGFMERQGRTSFSSVRPARSPGGH